MKRFAACLILLVFYLCPSRCQNIDNLDDLVAFLVQNPQNPISRIGVLSIPNFNSVRKRLPAGTLPLVVQHEEDLIALVLNETIVAALTSGLPDKAYHDRLHIIPSEVIALHTVLMAPDYSTDFPNGVKEPSLSTYQLSLAINAAICMIQKDGVDQQLAVKNGPKDITQAYTCKVDFPSQFKLPNKKDAVGLLADVLRTGKLKVLGDGPANWGDNDGNYLVDPPVGFFPDYLDAIVDYFANFSGPDGEKYGRVAIEREYAQAGPLPWYKLFEGGAHMTEPYFLLDSSYGGSGKRCQSDADCLPSDVEGKSERCNGVRLCEQSIRPKILMLRSSCTTVGTESVFYTKRTSSSSTTTDDAGRTESPEKKPSQVSPVAVGWLVTLAILSVGLLSLLGFVVFREKRGAPLFRP